MTMPKARKNLPKFDPDKNAVYITAFLLQQAVTMHVQNYYNILGIDPFASQDEVKRAYLKHLKEYHPDKKNGCNCFAYKRFQAVLEAYEAIKTPEKRLQYDELLRIQISQDTKPKYRNMNSKNDNKTKSNGHFLGWLTKKTDKRA